MICVDKTLLVRHCAAWVFGYILIIINVLVMVELYNNAIQWEPDQDKGAKHFPVHNI